MQRPLPRRLIESIAVVLFYGVYSYSGYSISLFLHTVLVLSFAYLCGVFLKQALSWITLRPKTAEPDWRERAFPCRVRPKINVPGVSFEPVPASPTIGL